jgi:dextranase
LYTYNGEKVELADRYQPLLNRLANELHTKVIFNAVSGYGMQQQFAGNTYDIIYEEIWDEHKTYASIKKVVDEFYVKTGGNKGAVLAAYMNHNAPGNAFNPVAVNLTNAVIMASGAAHLELGDTGMLSSEYYPGTSRTIPPELAESTRRYYDFSTAYEELLRGTGLKDTKARAVINGKFARTDGKIGRVWTFSKLKTWDDGKQAEVYHLLNFDGISSEQWGDKQASQTAPKTLMNTKVKLYTHIPVRQVSLATPDTATPADGLLQPVAFKTGWDLLGKYVTFTLPEMKLWNMVVLEPQ